MNKPSTPIADVQSSADTRQIAINKVGIKSIHHPVRVQDKSAGIQHTIAVFNMYVGLPHNFKGTHMSRLVALLESARAQSRTRGVPVVWRSTATGFRFEGLPPGTLPEQWLDASTTASGGPLVLGPEPVVGAQTLTVSSRQNPAWAQRLGTDGLRPFGLQGTAGATSAAAGAP